ncbi:LysM peptidoglycan-binding domain-containing protein [Nitrosomonas sp. ANs5]|uniref:LysM peptidoglycan-binding domain-containing protein n=1 Tax=Nitrosomonas sp. ANs5 TaxID=3423941 RepID=UPI003D34CC43
MRNWTIISVILFASLFSDASPNAAGSVLPALAPADHVLIPHADRPRRIAACRPDSARAVLLAQVGPSHAAAIPQHPATIRLSPRIRAEKLAVQAAPSIPLAKIAPFLSQPLVIGEHALEQAPVILGSGDGRVILSAGDRIYVGGLPPDQGRIWQIFRTGKVLIDPDRNDRLLGHEAVYLGSAEVIEFAAVSTVKLLHSVREILQGDRLVPAAAARLPDYPLHVPDLPLSGRIISVYGGVNEVGENAIVTLNLGVEDGIKPGHVLAVNRKSEARLHAGEWMRFPDERMGLVFVFRVFDKVCYALVMQSKQVIKVMDSVKSP